MRIQMNCGRNRPVNPRCGSNRRKLVIWRGALNSLRRSHAAEIGPMGQRAADWIGEVRSHEQTRIGRCFSVRIVAGKFEIFAVLPPSVLAADAAGTICLWDLFPP